MFDIGFTEILLCIIVGLVVIGPEQLPQTVRTVGLWIGRLKRSLRDTRAELERQIGADDIRRQLHNEEIMRSLEQANQRIQSSIYPGASESISHQPPSVATEVVATEAPPEVPPVSTEASTPDDAPATSDATPKVSPTLPTSDNNAAPDNSRS